MDELKVPKPEAAPGAGPEDRIRTAVSALTLAASALAVLAQIVEHFRKPAAGKGERTKAGTALLGLAVLKTLPALIKSAKALSRDIKGAK